jgi:FtsZ-binding cell division protein ZapB
MANNLHKTILDIKRENASLKEEISALKEEKAALEKQNAKLKELANNLINQLHISMDRSFSKSCGNHWQNEPQHVML